VSDQVVLVDIADRVGVITLNRPEARNALNAEVQRAFPAAIEALDTDDGVDVIILTGTDPAFCAGVDLKELGQGSADLVLPKTRRGPFPPHAKPIIGAINGVAVTGGLELALACDFLVASERARFADTHARVGVMPGWGMSVLLPRAVGDRRAREMSATGNFVDAATALAWGLVNRVVPHDELLATCRALAADIVSNDQVAVRRLMKTYDEVLDTTPEEGWEIEHMVAREWARAMDVTDVEARRRSIMDRGRTQI
jgi:enoyl-CoA hydratase